MNRTYHVWTIGCQMNEADSRRLAAHLEALGFREAADPAQAGLVVLNTCVVRQHAEDRAVGRLHLVEQWKKQRPDMVVGLMGCMVGLREEARLRQRFPFVDVFLPPSDPAPLLRHLGAGNGDEAKAIDAQDRARLDALLDHGMGLPERTRGQAVSAPVPVVLGCGHGCSFCIIPYRRGGERSVPPETVLREVRSLAAHGVREVVLLGQIVDRYGCDFNAPYDLADLLRDVARVEGLLRIRFLTGHPNYMSDRILEAVRDIPRVCPHIELPVQAGSDRVLDRMRRGYTAEDFRQVVARVRRIIPDAAIHTDVIVGFPGETEADFQDTLRLLEELRMDKIHLARYSERPQTLAARQMPDDVPEAEKARRWRLADALGERILLENNARWQNQRVEVLVEDRVRGRWRGRTPHNRLVFFSDDQNLRGALVSVRVVNAGAYGLEGAAAEVLVPPPATPWQGFVPL